MQPVGQAVPVSATAQNSTQANSADAATAAADFESFLTLLTAQLRNQDPLQPIDSTQFVAQLASFSSVEQQVKTNTLLTELATSLGAGTPERLAGLIGREVPAPVSVVYDGAPVEIQFRPVAGTGSATLVVRSDSGATVGQLAVDATGGKIRWDGSLTSGSAVVGAGYSFEIEVSDGNGSSDRQPGLVFSQIRQIRLDSTGPQLGFDGGAEMALADVVQIRAGGN